MAPRHRVVDGAVASGDGHGVTPQLASLDAARHLGAQPDQRLLRGGGRGSGRGRGRGRGSGKG